MQRVIFGHSSFALLFLLFPLKVADLEAAAESKKEEEEELVEEEVPEETSKKALRDRWRGRSVEFVALC